MPDHFGEELAPLPAIAMAAAHTTTLRVGALVFDNDYKHPAILAKEAATIDLLSDGRLELGIGAGWMKTDYDALGLPYDPPAVRVDRFEEALQVIKQCFAGEQFSYHGEHYRITDYTSYPKPAQAHRSADPRRRRRQARAVDRGARGRHRRHQPEPARGRGRADATARLAAGADRPARSQWVRDAAGDALRRHRDPDALLRRKRAPTTG